MTDRLLFFSMPDALIVLAFCAVLLLALSHLVPPWNFRSICLAILFFLMGYIHGVLYLVQRQHIYSCPALFFILAPVLLAMGPVGLMYMQSVTGERGPIVKKYLFHFVPSALSLAAMVPFLMKSADQKREFIYHTLQMGEHAVWHVFISLSACIAIAYIIFSVKDSVLYIKRNGTGAVDISHMLVLLFTWSFLEAVGISAMPFFWSVFFGINIALISIIIIALFMLSQRHPYLLRHAMTQGRNIWEGPDEPGPEDLQNVEKALEIFLDEERLYRHPDLTLAKLSAALEIDPRHLTRFLMERYNRNFEAHIIRYRIKEGKRLLATYPGRDPVQIAYAAGFNSYKAMHRAFKKYAGLSPVEYREKEK